MKKFALFFMLMSFVSCKISNKKNISSTKGKTFFNVYANLETEAVSSAGDSADDECFWYNRHDPEQSYIIGTDKKQGLIIYNLKGVQVQSFRVGRLNNVDLRYGFSFKHQKVALLTASNRTTNSVSIFTIDHAGTITYRQEAALKSKTSEVYGLGMYKSPITKKFYTVIISKKGEIEQWEIKVIDNKITGEIVRKGTLSTQSEGFVADDYHKKMYVAEEDSAIWAFPAEPDNSIKFTKIIGTDALNMKADFEGITIYDKGKGEGYLILSSQGNNTYGVLDRVTHQYLKSFKIASSDTIDGTSDTDGIDAVSFPLKKYPKGFFIAQDGENISGGKPLNQNFKIVDWRTIEKVLK